MHLQLRGPLGHGFKLPPSARRVALAALDDETPARLFGLLEPALAQSAAVTLACDFTPPGLPADVEVQPLAALPELVCWADYLALDARRAQLPGLAKCLGLAAQAGVPCEAQVLVCTPMPCGALAECGVCAVPVRRGHLLACKDGPVFSLPEILA
jgi:dihydroorotate dehydrogenase electron transfer subunit